MQLLNQGLGFKQLASFLRRQFVTFIYLGKQFVAVARKSLIFFFYVAQFLTKKIHLPF